MLMLFLECQMYEGKDENSWMILTSGDNLG